MDACESLIRAPEECTPENFNMLLVEGRLDEYRELEERCYVKAEHISNLIDCLEYVVDKLEEMIRERIS